MGFTTESGDSAVGRSPRFRRMVELGEVIDRLVEADRELAIGAARRASIVEEARVLSQADAAACALEAHAGEPGAGEDGAGEAGAAGRPRSESGWTTEVTAWRELVSEIACALRIPERTAETLVGHSRILAHDLPATRAALAAGEISYRHVEKLIDHACSLPRESYASFEEAVLPFARELTVAKFDRRARALRERIHPESISTRTTVAREMRDVYLDPARDGMAYLSAYLPAEVATAGFNRIDDIATSLSCSGETRTQAQLRADAFGDLVIDGITTPETMTLPAPFFTEEEIPVLAEQHLAELERMGIDGDYERIVIDLRADLDHHAAVHERNWASLNGIGHGITAKVLVTVPVLSLLGETDEPATLEGYGPIDPRTAKELAAGATSFTRILTHPETGAVLSVGRDSYQVPSDLKRWLQLRDETCRHPGCNKRAQRCDLDHTLDWRYDGESSHDNLAHLCRGHHHLKHHTAWRYQHVDESGTLEFTSPTGHTYTTHPAQRMKPPRFT